jgi:hypothetical protein
MRSAAPRAIRSLRHPEGLRRLLHADHDVVVVSVWAGGAGDVGSVGVSWSARRVSTRVILEAWVG